MPLFLFGVYVKLWVSLKPDSHHSSVPQINNVSAKSEPIWLQWTWLGLPRLTGFV